MATRLTMPYAICVPTVDWITATTYELRNYDYWVRMLRNYKQDAQDKRVMQYLGWQQSTPLGSFYVGSGEQRGREHHMLRVSGMLADIVRDEIINMPGIRCTRVDLQYTIERPGNWSQIGFLNRMQSTRRTVGYIESRRVVDNESQPLATVYVGSRQSDRMVRVYEKPIDGDGLIGLRFEVEYKGERAARVWREIARGTKLGDILRGEVQRIRDDKLEEAYASLMLDGDPVVVRVPVMDTDIARSERWLQERVLPTFERVINSHESDGRVAAAYQDALDRLYGRIAR